MFGHLKLWSTDEEEVVLEDLDPSVLIVTNLDTLVKCVIPYMVVPPKMLTLLRPRLQLTKDFLYLKKNIMSSFSIEQSSTLGPWVMDSGASDHISGPQYGTDNWYRT
nr:uncharacterized protein LOC117279049 [Nicotiana tomentosiformis]